MIPSIEAIVDGLVAGTYTPSQAVSWLHQHAAGAVDELRDAFAMSATTGICASKDEAGVLLQHGYEWIAAESYRIADAMLRARSAS